MLRRIALTLCLGAGTACGVVITNNGSNLPDGGQCPAVDGGGAATLDGPLAFAVASALESDIEVTPLVLDGGVPVLVDGGFEEGDAGPPLIDLWLTGAPCEPDAGACAFELVLATLVGSADAGSWNGSYALGATRGSSLQLQSYFDDGGTSSLTAYDAVSGQVTITSTGACSLIGTFAAVLGGVDGGSDGGSPLSGTFQAVYFR